MTLRLAGILVLCCCTARTVAATATEAPSIRIESVSLGFDGHYKVGCWTPVHVTVSGTSPVPLQLLVTAPDSDAVAATVTRLVDPGRTTVESFTRIGRITGQVVVEIRQDDSVLARHVLDLSKNKPLPSSDYLVVTVGEVPHIADALASHPVTRQMGTSVARISDILRLPTRWFGYEGVDAVVLCGGLAEVQLLNQADHRVYFDALETWARLGGQLVVSIDDQADTLLATGSSLSRLVPGDAGQIVNLPQLNALEVYSGSQEQLLFEDDVGRPLVIRGVKLTDVSGRIVLFEGRQATDFPLLVRSALGFGEVVFLPVDLARPQFARWDGTRNLLAKLLHSDRADESASQVELPGELAHIGYDDLAGQLRTALDQFSQQGVTLIPFEVFFLLSVAYILLIAPGDYFFLKRWLRRMELTWITFPLLVVVASSGAYCLATWAKGREMHLNQVDLVDIDLEDGRFRGASWFTLFSPKTSVYDVSQQTRFAVSEPPISSGSAEVAVDASLLGWFGLPGGALGGMQSTAAAPQIDSAYRFGPQFKKLEALPIQIWSTKALVGRHHGWTTEQIKPQLALSSATVDRLVTGTITNQLDVALHDCALFFEGWVYPLGTIRPGESAVMKDDLNTDIRTVESYLTRLGDWSAETAEQRTDVDRILSRMMFYEAAGGLDYTPLKNRYQAFVDLSHLLAAGRAVLVGRADQTAFQAKVNETVLSVPRQQQQTIYRFVFSIRPEAADQPDAKSLPEDSP